jgi:hypothetical protein
MKNVWHFEVTPQQYPITKMISNRQNSLIADGTSRLASFMGVQTYGHGRKKSASLGDREMHRG